VILEVNGKTIEHTGQLRNMVAGMPVGEKVKIKIFRDTQAKEVELTVGEQSKEMAKAEKAEEATISTALSGIEVQDLNPETAKQLNLPNNQRGSLSTA
jgi:PDZ domain-containing secreted protein